MDPGSGLDSSRRAVAFVEAASRGGPLPRGLEVTVHFHPDRLFRGVPLLRHLVTDGVYRSQFETGTGNGGLTAYPGGDRWRWEHRMFGGAYDDSPAVARPKYGALNLRRRPAGGGIRFGSSHLRVAPPVLQRTTFCWPDSHLEPTLFGTARRAALVLDPSFSGTEVEAAAHDLAVPLEWHHGFVLTVPELRAHEHVRGPAAVRVGTAIAEERRLDARIIGAAAATGRHDPQTLKHVWHHVARFGSPA
jgi:hypothetical protein